MNDEQVRITVLTEMFLGLGHEPTPERIAYYVRLTKNVPTKYYRVACDSAVCKSKTGFPATPGQIIEEAERIHRDLVISGRDEMTQKMRAEIRAEFERERETGEVGTEDIIDLAMRRAMGSESA